MKRLSKDIPANEMLIILNDNDVVRWVAILSRIVNPSEKDIVIGLFEKKYETIDGRDFFSEFL